MQLKMIPDLVLAEKQEAILCQTAFLGHAFSNQHRLKIVSLLAQSPKTVELLARDIGQSVASTSPHLKVLRATGVVTSHKFGRHVRYELRSQFASTFALNLMRLARELLPEVRETVRDYFEDRGDLSPLTQGELLSELQAGRAIALDLRPEDEFANGHIPGALHLPFCELRAHAGRLPRKADLLAHCRGPYCLIAVHGTDILRSMGFNARRLGFGVPEWKACNNPVETSFR